MVYRERFKDKVKQKAYMNACDCLFYGDGQELWDDCGLDAVDRREVWAQARFDVGI